MQSATPPPPPPPEVQQARTNGVVVSTRCPVDPEFSVYVGNLDPGTSVHDIEELLYELFLQAGPLSVVHVPFFHDTDRHKGYGFVEFQHMESVEYSLKLMTGVRLFGRLLTLGPAATPLTSSSSSTSSSAPTAIANPFVSAFQSHVALKETANPFLNTLNTHVGGPVLSHPQAPLLPLPLPRPPGPSPLLPNGTVSSTVPPPLIPVVPPSIRPLLHPAHPPPLLLPRVAPTIIPRQPPPPPPPILQLPMPLPDPPPPPILQLPMPLPDPPPPHQGPILSLLPTPPSARPRPLFPPSSLPSSLPSFLPPQLEPLLPAANTPNPLQQTLAPTFTTPLVSQPVSVPSFSLNTITSSTIITTTGTSDTASSATVVSFGIAPHPHGEPNITNSTTVSFAPPATNREKRVSDTDGRLSLSLTNTVLQMLSANKEEEEEDKIQSLHHDSGPLGEGGDSIATTDENGFVTRSSESAAMEGCPLSLETYLATERRSSPNASYDTDYQGMDHDGYPQSTGDSGTLSNPLQRYPNSSSTSVSDHNLFTSDDTDEYQRNSGFLSFSIDENRGSHSGRMVESESHHNSICGDQFDDGYVNGWQDSNHHSSSPYKNGSHHEPCLPDHNLSLPTNTDRDNQEFVNGYHSGPSHTPSGVPHNNKIKPFGPPPTKLHQSRLGRRDHPQWLNGQTRERISNYHYSKIQNTLDQLKEAMLTKKSLS